MSILSGLFGNSGGNESESSSDLFSDLDAVLSVDFSNESYHQEVDEDGSSETSYDSTSFGTDLDLGSVIASMTDSFSESDGLFG